VTYHWRVLATNANGTSGAGADHTFVYDTSGGGLPDGRAYEMVTPAQKNAATVGLVFGNFAPLIAENGSRVASASVQCFAQSESCIGDRETVGAPYAFMRTRGGWVTKQLAPPATPADGNSYWKLGADTDTALFSIATEPMGEDDFYARRADGSFADIGPTSPPALGAKGVDFFGKKVVVSTSDDSTVAYEAQEPVWPSDSTTGTNTVYEYTGTGNAEPALVGVRGGFGDGDLISACGTQIGDGNNAVTPGMLSADGRTVFFTALACPASGVPVDELFARIDRARTVPISEPSTNPGCTTTSCLANTGDGHQAEFRDALFQGASADGSQVFFTSPQQLLDSAGEDVNSGDTAKNGGCPRTSAANGCNLYLYSGAQETPPSGGHLVDVSAGDTSGRGPRVQGVLGISFDGSRVYFIAKGVLSLVANRERQVAASGRNNLYVFEAGAGGSGGRVTFIASLPSSDAREWTSGTGVANVTPDGRFLVFTSHGALTPDVVHGEGPVQVFRYDAASGTLVRVSIGERGFNDNGNAGSGDASIAEASRGVAARSGPARSDPTMSHDGAFVFFQSPVALTKQALNDVAIDSGGELAQNIYEYHDGQVYLISDGRDTTQESNASSVTLFGSDATGANVFFSTADQLVAQDTDTQLDYYDARICAVGDPCIASPSLASTCAEAACHAMPGAPTILASPASAMFFGAGNLAPPVTNPTKPKSAAHVTALDLIKALKRCKTKARSLRRACEAKARRRIALEACRRGPRNRRAACEAQVRRRFGPRHDVRKSSRRLGQ
jgi:hypothetical protein